MPPLAEKTSAWRDAVRRLEDLGYSAVNVADHFTQGSVMEPSIAMMAAADATDSLRVLCTVFCNDYRHPVMLHKTAAMIDVLSDGRLELGMGAGWMITDYEAAGMPYDKPAVRVRRLEEAVQVVKGLFGSGPLTFEGEYYRINGLEGTPKSAQQPHPPIMIGGGGKRVLSLAGREAQIIGINPNLRAGEVGPEAALDASAERTDEKVSWVRAAAAAAGRSDDDYELQNGTFMVRVTETAAEADGLIQNIGNMFGQPPETVAQSPAILIGSVEQCVEKLLERRERWGLNYVGLGGDPDSTAPIVAKLSGA